MIIPDPIQFIATVQFRAVEALIQQGFPRPYQSQFKPVTQITYEYPQRFSHGKTIPKNLLNREVVFKIVEGPFPQLSFMRKEERTIIPLTIRHNKTDTDAAVKLVVDFIGRDQDPVLPPEHLA